MTDFLTNIAPEIFYALCGLVCLDAGWRAFRKNDKAKYGRHASQNSIAAGNLE